MSEQRVSDLTLKWQGVAFAYFTAHMANSNVTLRAILEQWDAGREMAKRYPVFDKTCGKS